MDAVKTKESKRLQSAIQITFEGCTVGRTLITGMPCLGILGFTARDIKTSDPSVPNDQENSDLMCGEGMLRGEFGH